MRVRSTATCNDAAEVYAAELLLRAPTRPWARASRANASSVTAACEQAVERCLPPPLVMLVQQGLLRPVPRDNGG